MSTYDAVAVFGTRLKEDGTFLPFVYHEIDRAVARVTLGQARYLVFCGSHWAGEKFRGVKECDVAEQYLRDTHPDVLPYFHKEDQSTTLPENWLYMKRRFSKLRRIHHITITPFAPRMQFCGDWIYGDHAELSFETLPWPTDDFPHEPQLLRDVKCMFTVHKQMTRGDDSYLLYPGTENSRWMELWREHGAHCRRCYPKVK